MRILCVEDNKDSLELLKVFLEGSGYKVSIATNGIEALDAARKTRPDIIISDILMPEMDGFALCRNIKGDTSLKDVPFIFYTATYLDPKDRELGLALGAARYLEKPMELSELLKAIDDVMEEARYSQLTGRDATEMSERETDRAYEQALAGKLEKKISELEEQHEVSKQSQRMLRQSEERFRDFASAASDWFWEMGPDLRFSYFSEQAVERLGISPDKIIGKTRREVGHVGLHREGWEAHLADLDAHRPFRDFEYEIENGNFVSVSGIPVFGDDGEFLGYRGTGTDITALKNAEEALRRSHDNLEKIVEKRTEELKNSEEILTAAIENIPGGFLMTDVEDHISLFNRQFEQLYSELKDIIFKGAPVENFFRTGAERGVYPSARGRIEEWILERLIRHRKKEDSFEEKLSNGRWVSVALKEIPGRFRVGIHMDITELKKARDDAEAANKSKSTFLANMSHEIRTPMNGVVGMVEVLMQMEMEPEQRRMIQTIKRSSFSLLRIIDDILDTSKIEAGKLELERVPVHLGPVLEGIAETLTSSADKKGVRLSLFINPAVPEWIYSDAVRLRQILLNLANNAVKFSRREKGGKPGLVDIRARLSEAGVLLFTVTDNGIGMSEQVRSRLFKPFSQGEQSTTRQFGGTGLGLMISANLVRMMGGAIEVDSTPDEGSTFTVRLPLKVADGESTSPDISSLEVLALVDDLMNREVLFAYIEGNGATIRYAENEAELSSLVSASKGEPIVALALGKMADNDRVREEFTDTEGQLRFLNFTTNRSDRLGLVLPNSYVIQSFPILPSDVLRSLAVLAGRESPDIDLSTAERVPSADAPTIEEAEAQNRLILLVEDDTTNQLVIKHQLNILGYAMEIAVDGKQGLEMWQTGRFNLVLSDCHMPVMDGFEMTDAIREAEKQTGSPHVPIVAITANALQGEAERCLELGMDDYLTKPVELERLGHVLRRWLPKMPKESL